MVNAAVTVDAVVFEGAVVFNGAVTVDAVVFGAVVVASVVGVITETSVLLGLLNSTDPFVASLVTGESREPGKGVKGGVRFTFAKKKIYNNNNNNNVT